MSHSVVGIRQVQVSVCSFLGKDDHTNDTTGASVPLDSLPQSPLDEVDSVILLHTLSPVGITVTVDVSRSRTTDGIGLLMEGTTQGDGVDLATESLIPTSNNQTGTAYGG